MARQFSGQSGRPIFACFTTLLLCALPCVPLSLRSQPAPKSVDSGPGIPLKPQSNPGRPVGFSLLKPDQTGVRFTNSLSELDAARNRVLVDGSGVAVGDYDGDKLPDLFFASLDSKGRLFRNLGGMKFEEIPDGAGITGWKGPIRGVVFADINGDGWNDLLGTVTRHSIQCFTNNGAGRFGEFTGESGLGGTAGSMTLALADVDGNGTLDLYSANYRSEDIRDRPGVELQMVGGRLTVPPAWSERLMVASGQVFEYGEPDQLYLNDGRGRFTPVSWTGGRFLDEHGFALAGPPRDWGLSATFRDLNGDGLPDLYVCNDYWTPDRIWVNQGQGRFQAAPARAFPRHSANSMGVDIGDLDRDGHNDIYVVDMLSRDPARRKWSMTVNVPEVIAATGLAPVQQSVQNTLLRNRGDGTYEETAWYSGVAASDWSWQPILMDVDLDGWEDLIISAGHLHEVQDLDANARIDLQPQPWRQQNQAAAKQDAYTRQRMTDSRLYPKLEMPLVTYRNLGGLKFEETTTVWGTKQPAVHHGLITSDLDGDGDLDLVVNNLNGPAAIYQNENVAPRVTIRLRGLAPNTAAIGARVRFSGGAQPRQDLEVLSGGRYLSGGDSLLVFATGTNAGPFEAEVRWNGGSVTVFTNLQANHHYDWIEETGAKPTAKRPTEMVETPLFQNWRQFLNHTHAEDSFDDRTRQPLLPRSLARLGPGLAWTDFNGDGLDDLIIGAARNGAMAVYRNNGQGKFTAIRQTILQRPITRDQTGILTTMDGRTNLVVLAGSSNYEDAQPTGAVVRQYPIQGEQPDDSLPGMASSAGPLCRADFDGDGRTDLFVGGRVIPSMYPVAADSLLFKGTGGRFVPDPEATKVFKGIGLVSGATAGDLDEDGVVELILATEWGPIRVFSWKEGGWRERTAEFGFSAHTGWWNSVVCGDFDGDGKLDLVAGNWGLNSPYAAGTDQPVRIHFGELREPGLMELLESQVNPRTKIQEPLWGLEVLSGSMPILRERFASHRTFSATGSDGVLKALPAAMAMLEVTTLESSIFLNRGGRFERKALPREAQMTAAFGLAVADFDGDGREDLFVAQNFRGTLFPEFQRTSGQGLLLKGGGDGSFEALGSVRSGFSEPGEQRAAAVADFDRDGRPDLAVTQNNGATLLFRNATGRPGLRVKLAGEGGNRDGVGARMRLKYSDGFGPMRSVGAGSGYWAQDSATLVLAKPRSPVELEIHWPGGGVSRTRLTGDELEVRVDAKGEILEKR